MIVNGIDISKLQRIKYSRKDMTEEEREAVRQYERDKTRERKAKIAPEQLEKERQEDRERQKKYRETHREIMKERNRAYNRSGRSREIYYERRLKVYNHYGNVCACCGESNPKFLTIDHINNDGGDHREEVGAGDALIRWIIKNNFPKNLQLLCWNCNCGRAQNKGICPQKRLL